MLDVLIIIWKVFVGIVIALATIFLIGFIFVKFIEFWRGEEGDDYRR